MNYKSDKLFSLADIFIEIVNGSDGNIYVFKYDYSYLDANDYLDCNKAREIMREWERVAGKDLVYWVQVYTPLGERVKLSKRGAKKWAVWYHKNRLNLSKWTLD